MAEFEAMTVEAIGSEQDQNFILFGKKKKKMETSVDLRKEQAE